MKAREIAAVFETIAPIEAGIAQDRASGFLGFRFGDRNVEVKGVGVAWWLSMEVVEQAVERGLNFLIIHEPELFRQWDSFFHSNLQAAVMPFNLRKMKLLLDNGITVYTAHTNWDLQMEVGMAPTVAKALGFGKEDLVKYDVGVGVWRVKDSFGKTFGKLAAHVKSRMGLPFVRVQGKDEMPVRTVVVGYGSIGSEVEAIVANDADAGIFGELREWPFIQAREQGVGIIEMTHVRSESVGFSSVVTEMSRLLPGVKFEFLEVPYPCRIA
ncbi:MAG: Nif3-like dinuclear metal center hexameric protein [Phycisphaerae bacterium]